MYIFGKFETFQRRLYKILNMFSTITTYSALQDSKIEGLETMATTFQVYCSEIRIVCRPYLFRHDLFDVTFLDVTLLNVTFLDVTVLNVTFLDVTLLGMT